MTFATLTLRARFEEGVPIEAVMAQIGHVSPEMTRHYTHLRTNAKHAAVAAVQRRSSGVLLILEPGINHE
jgi:integrase